MICSPNPQHSLLDIGIIVSNCPLFPLLCPELHVQPVPGRLRARRLVGVDMRRPENLRRWSSGCQGNQHAHPADPCRAPQRRRGLRPDD